MALDYPETGQTDLGEWEVTHIEHSEPERVMRIEATSAALPGLLGHGKLSQGGVTVGQLAEQIAARHGLRADVDEDLAGIVRPHLDQDESDAHLRTRGSTVSDSTNYPEIT